MVPIGLALLLALLPGWSSTVHAIRPADAGIIDFASPADLAGRRPLLIAHRGGVITATAPEGSLAAIRLAALDGYDMVELDIRMTSDEQCVVFHDKSLEADTGRPGRAEDLSLAQAVTLHLGGTAEKIPTLEQALSLCADLRLGVMLDFKMEGTVGYYRRILESLEKWGLLSATITITSLESVRRFFRGKIWVRVLSEGGEDTQGEFAFDRASAFPDTSIAEWHNRGVLVLPALNTFHYLGPNPMAQAADDARRLLAAGADGFQIDSVYLHVFGLPLRGVETSR